MTSFVLAFDDYNARVTDKKIPVVDFAADILGFTFDYTKNLIMAPMVIKKFYNTSPSFRDRIDSHLSGNYSPLESWTRSKYSKMTQDSTLSDVLRFIKIAAGSFTALGDILGVLGYSAVYDSMIRNGATQEEALRKFEAFNSTQQTRRGTELSSIQQSKNSITRMFVMFGSS